MKSLLRVLSVSVALFSLLLFTGCQEANVDDGSSSSDGSGSSSADGTPQEEVVRDTAYIVIDKRQQGGQLVPSGEVSDFDDRPRMTRSPLESMIIVKGNETGQESAYLLPTSDYNVVQVGHRLQESTLRKWETTQSDHIPPPPPPPESPLRSRTGGAAENLVY